MSNQSWQLLDFKGVFYLARFIRKIMTDSKALA